MDTGDADFGSINGSQCKFKCKRRLHIMQVPDKQKWKQNNQRCTNHFHSNSHFYIFIFFSLLSYLFPNGTAQPTMNTPLPPLPSTSSSSTLLTHSLHCSSSPPSLFSTTTTTTSKPSFFQRVQATTSQTNPKPNYDKNLSLTTPTNSDQHNLLTKKTNYDQTLLSLLRQRKTNEAWNYYTQLSHLPNPTCLSRLVSQLSYQNTRVALTHAQSILTRLRHERQLHRLDANSLGLLAVSATKSGQLTYAVSLINSMLRSGYLPHVKAWSAVVSRLGAAGDDGPVQAIKLFKAITRRTRRFSDEEMVKESKPDTAAFNNVLNACANLGDGEMFLKLFDEMDVFGVEPDILSYNVVIKLCARCNRKDLLVFVLERVIEKGIPLCVTTLHSLVAAFVGFGDLEKAEKMVQAMREGRRDLCTVLRDASLENFDGDEEDRIEKESGDLNYVFEKLLPNSVDGGSKEPPLLPKVYAPDSRIYTTLMKGYMKQGRVSDTVRMLEAMRAQDDTGSHPDHVSYTTVVSALVKAGSMDRARQVLAEMTRIGVPANRITYNILLKGYCQQLQINKAKELLKEMSEDTNIQPDVVSYNTLIDGCIQVDDSAGALALFNEMRAKGITPTKISYTTLMKAFALSGQPKLANKVFDEMVKDPRVKVDLIAWNMLVEGYCRLGLIEEAKKIIAHMRENGFYPDVATYGSLANGIAVARRPGEALLLWKEVKERWIAQMDEKSSDSDSPPPPPLKPDEGLLETLADICVRAAFFQKALEIVACMEENGIPPNKTKYKKIYVEMHSRMFTSKHASQARQDRRRERKRAAEAFKFWLGLPNAYYGSEWRLDPVEEGDCD